MPARGERPVDPAVAHTGSTHFWAKIEESFPIHSGGCIESHEENCENHSHILGGWRSHFRITFWACRTNLWLRAPNPRAQRAHNTHAAPQMNGA
eukprot:1880233-Prymnesium_polylepis.1